MVKKGNKHPNPAPAPADENGRQKKTHWRCCPDLCEGQWLGNSNGIKLKSHKYRANASESLDSSNNVR